MKMTRDAQHTFDSKQHKKPTTRLLVALFFLVLNIAGAYDAHAQSTCGNTKLVCLIPTVLHTTSSTFNFFNTAFATQIAQLPQPSRASGFLFTLDKSLGVYTVSQQSFGPVLSERAETIGRNKLYLAFNYQRYGFGYLDGNSLKNLSILFYFPTVQTPQVVTNPSTRVDAKFNQYVASGTYGITDKLDASISVPFGLVTMGVGSQGTEYSTTTNAMASFSEYLAGSAAGVGDVVFSGKYGLWKLEKFSLAVGGEFRIPTGSARNFLGSGAYGLEPYVVMSRRARVTPHLDLGYQWNSKSVLATNSSGQQQNLPGFFAYDAGVDIGATRKVTVVADLLGQVFFNAPQITTPRTVTTLVNNQPKSFNTVVQTSGSYNVDNFAIGVKGNPWRNLLITANVSIKLNEAGLRATAVPLAGVSYSF
jgi:hypothetical protein